MSRKLPQELSEKQEMQRQQTINKVLRAITDLEAQGSKVSIKNLVAFSGLSRSTLAKPHVREQLMIYGLFKPPSDAIATMKKIKQSEAIAKKDKQVRSLQIKNSELEKECELLRGRLFLLMQGQQNN